MYGLGGYDNTQSTPNDSNSSIDIKGNIMVNFYIYLGQNIEIQSLTMWDKVL